MANEGVFSETPVEPVAVSVEDLVGEGRKYASVEELAKAYVNADRFIGELKSKTASLETKVQTYEDVIKNTRTGEERKPEQRQENQPEAPNPEKSAEDFKKIARETFEEISQTERVRRNQERAAERMVEVYGSTEKANQAVRQKAQELNVSVDWLLDTAGRSPHAFEATMGLTNRQEPRSDYAPKNDFVPRDPPGKTKERKMSYYNDLRRKDPKTYWSRETQDELFREASRQGDAFYD